VQFIFRLTIKLFATEGLRYDYAYTARRFFIVGRVGEIRVKSSYTRAFAVSSSEADFKKILSLFVYSVSMAR